MQRSQFQGSINLLAMDRSPGLNDRNEKQIKDPSDEWKARQEYEALRWNGNPKFQINPHPSYLDELRAQVERPSEA